MSDAAEPEVPKREYRKTAARDVFAVDRLAFEIACGRGLNAAVAYLVIAQGTLGDNRTSRWSVAAIERHTGIGRRRARAAIQALLTPPALIEVTKTSDKKQAAPRYRLLPASAATEYVPDLIWLPKRLVAGTKLIPLRDGETAPVEMIRRTQSLPTLRLFILLYAEQSLFDSGGIEWRRGAGIWTAYHRETVGKSAQFTVLGFKRGEHWVTTATAFQVRLCSREEDFWEALTNLKTLGLIVQVDHLVESHSAEAELVVPLAEPGAGRPEEQAVRRAAIAAGRRLLNDRKREVAEDAGLILVPVLHQFADANMLIGVWRLRYLPWTQMTVDWRSRADEWAAFARFFDTMNRDAADMP